MGDSVGYTNFWARFYFFWAFISVATERALNKFGCVRREKGEIFWRKILKDWHNGVIKQAWPAKLWNVSFCS